MNPLRLAFAALACLLTTWAPAFAQPMAAVSPTVAQVDAIFARWTGRDSPGCAVAVGRGGQTVLTRAYGMADLEHDVPNTPATVFEAGSVSKQFTAAAIALLAQQGRLSIDDDVRKFVPEVPDYGATITIRHLLTHTSGLRDWGAVLEAAGWPRGTRLNTNAHVLDIVSRQKALNFPPGSEYLYSNTGYNLLAVIVERVSRTSFLEFTRRRLFEPLGMAHTRWRADISDIVPDRAVAYSRSEEGFRNAMPFENAFGNGGLLTTVGDLLLWNENLVSGTVGGTELARELQRQARLTSGRQIAYAEGLVVGRYKGVAEVSHSGSTAGYRAFLSRYPDAQVSVALLCNVAQADPTVLAHQVAEAFIDMPVSTAPVVQPALVDAAVLASRSGLYRSRRTHEPMRLAVEDGALRRDGTTVLTPLSDSRFSLAGGTIEFRPEGGLADAVLRLSIDGDSIDYDRVASVSPTPVQLAEYRGEYRSDEAEVTYTAEVSEGSLVLRRKPATTLALTPSYRDTFTTGNGWIVRFLREGGRVTGMSLGLARVRDLRFERLSPEPVSSAPQ